MDIQRLILLMILTFSLVMLWEGWQKHNQPVPAAVASVNAGAATTSAAPGSAAVPTASGTLVAAGAAVPSGKPTVVTADVAENSTISVKTDLYLAEISTQGGNIVRLDLRKHKATGDNTRDFRLFDNGEHGIYEAQSGLLGNGLPNHKTRFVAESTAYEMKAGQESLTVRLVAPEVDGVKVTKVLTFHSSSYLIDVAYRIANGSAAPLAANAYFQLLRDDTEPKAEASMVKSFTGPAIYSEAEKYQKVKFEDIDEGKEKHAKKANNGWIGIVQHYFVAAWLPKGSSEREFFTKKVGNKLFTAGVILPMAPIAAGAIGSIETSLYAGPQEQRKLAELAPGLDLVVDYGFLTLIAAPIFWMLQWLHGIVGNWGWAIILLTVLIKLAFFPLSAASYKSMARMRLVTPKMSKIKEQFGHDRAKMNQEMMELYKKEKINPLGGCLPILVQIPVFISLYWVLLATVEMRHAPWVLWIVDLSTKDPYFVLPIIMGATMLIQTKLNPTPPDPIQAKVMLAMPIVFTGMFLFFPSGLVLYWVVNNVLSIAQQWKITRMIEGGSAKPAH